MKNNEPKPKNLKINRWTFLVAGILFILMGSALKICYVFGALLIALAYATNKKYKECIAEQNKEPEVIEEEPKEEQKKEFYFFTFKVAGVTFKNGRKTRQAILRSFKYGDEEMETVDLEPYIYEGRDAVYVKINDQIVGNIPSDRVAEFMDLRSKYPYEVTICDIYGGHKLDDGSRANFGCEVVVRFKLI